MMTVLMILFFVGFSLSILGICLVLGMYAGVGGSHTNLVELFGRPFVLTVNWVTVVSITLAVVLGPQLDW